MEIYQVPFIFRGLFPQRLLSSIKAPNSLLPSSFHFFPEDEKTQNLLLHMSLLENMLRLGHIRQLVSFRPTANAGRKLKGSAGRERKEKGGKNSTKHKRKPPKVQT